VRLEHAQVLRVADLARVGALGIVASVQPSHGPSDMPWAVERLGAARMRGAYAWRSMAAAGAVLAAGSDFPIERHEPAIGLHAAVTRRRAGCSPRAALASKERMGREEALVAYTAAPAYVSGELHRTGTITPGKLADLVVWDRNLVACDAEDLSAAAPLATLVGGRPVWTAPGYGGPPAEEIAP
jgi:hypothetical protein